jgi:hypothetical protein
MIFQSPLLCATKYGNKPISLTISITLAVMTRAGIRGFDALSQPCGRTRDPCGSATLRELVAAPHRLGLASDIRTREASMRRLLLFVSISLLAGSSAYSPASAQGYGNPPGYRAPPPPAPYTGSKEPAPGYREPPPQAPYAGSRGPASGSQMSSSENCGTPDEPKPCPPMPRRPLSHYPNNKQ